MVTSTSPVLPQWSRGVDSESWDERRPEKLPPNNPRFFMNRNRVLRFLIICVAPQGRLSSKKRIYRNTDSVFSDAPRRDFITKLSSYRPTGGSVFTINYIIADAAPCVKRRLSTKQP